MRFGKRAVLVLGVLVIAAAAIYLFGFYDKSSPADSTSTQAGDIAFPTQSSVAAPIAPQPGQSVDLNETQVKAIKYAPAETHTFSQQRVAVGSIDFNENLSVQVFPPYQGKIIKAEVDIGDEVVKGQRLYTIDSPDLIQAESTLIAAAGVYDLTTEALTRAKDLYENQGLAQKEYEQAQSDQMTAEGDVKADRDAVRVFGKSEAQIDEIVARRRIDPALVVRSPIGGRVTAREAQPGLLVQPGNPPAPYTVSDISTMWMLANVAEADSPMFKLGQQVRVKVMAFPDHDFAGKISAIGATVDASTHTTLVRSEVSDPKHELRPGMFATYVISVGNPVTATAIPLPGVVREGDGSMSIWLTADHHRFFKRTVKIGLQQDGFDQIVDGLQPGETVVTDGAVFLSNMLNGGAPDS